MRARGRRAPLALAAAAAAVLTFVPSLSHAWLNWDDWLMVADNPFVRGFSRANLRWAFASAPTGAYQPLAYLSWTLDWSLWGREARGYVLGSVLLHGLAAALAFLAARRLLALSAPRAEREPAWALDAAALFAALVFALHPLRVESVSWIAERRDPLCGVLWLGALLAYLRAREPGRPPRPLAPVLLLFAAACLAKGVAVTLPLVLIVVDLWALERDPREALVEKLPMLALGAALGVLAFALQAGERAAWRWSDHGLAARLAQCAYALAFYVRKTAWPAGLSPFYELRPPLDPLEPRFVLSAAAVAAFAAAAWSRRRARPGLAAAGAAYAAVLLPVSGLLQAGAQLVADRYSYLACLPWALLAGAAWRESARRARAASLALAAAVLAALAGACVAQQAHWRDSSALWERVLSLDPASPTGWINLGAAAAGAGRPAAAREDFARALAADPACPPLVARLGAALDRGDEGGVESARAALDTRPVCRKSLANLGAAGAALGRREEARRWLRLGLAADPGDAAARLNLERLERTRLSVPAR